VGNNPTGKNGPRMGFFVSGKAPHRPSVGVFTLS